METGFIGWKAKNPEKIAPAVTTFKCEHVWKPATLDELNQTGPIISQSEYLMCKKCRGYWHPKLGWTREPRRVKKLMADDGIPRA